MFRKTSLLLHKALFLKLSFYVFYNNFTTFNVCNITNPLNNNNTIWFKDIKPTVKINIVPYNAQGLFFIIMPLLFYIQYWNIICHVLYTVPI